MAEYASMFVISGLAAILFLGGWNGPVPITHWLGLTRDAAPLAAWLGNFLGMCNMLLKCSLGVVAMMWLRWTLPRLRIDQVMTVCLRYCIPLAAVALVGAMWWTYARPLDQLFGRRVAGAERSEAPVSWAAGGRFALPQPPRGDGTGGG